MNHNCPGKRKLDELRSPVGQAAYAHYCKWMELQRHSVPPIETFAESKFYSTFIKFAQHVAKVRLPNVEAFIRTMVNNGKVPPALWTRDSVYSMYLRVYDDAVSPAQQFVAAYDELVALAQEAKVPLEDVFTTLTTPELMDLIERRKLTHWLLLASSKFKTNLLSRSQEERELIGSVMQIGAALERMKQEPKLVREFAEAAKEIGL